MFLFVFDLSIVFIFFICMLGLLPVVKNNGTCLAVHSCSLVMLLVILMMMGVGVGGEGVVIRENY